MIYDKILFSRVQPSRTDIAWAKPLTGGGFALYLFFDGKWQPQKQMNDMGTFSPDDDVIQDISGVGDITEAVEQEVARQIAEHDENVNDTHHTSSSNEEEYPDINII